MRWIDKSGNRKVGLQNTSDFLNSHCSDQNGRCTGIRYDNRDDGTNESFCHAENGKFRKTLTQLLLSEQNSMCCYCLRRLKTAQDEDWSDQKITLEHIIPRSCDSSAEAQYYQTAPGLSKNDVELTVIYESPEYTQKPNIHPHKVAYNNLVVSCNGTFPEKTSNKKNGKQKICCNLKRGNLEAYPIYFFKDVGIWVDYLKDGDVQAVINAPKSSQVATLITNTNLQCDSLKDIRYIWYLLRNKEQEAIFLCNDSETKRCYLLGEILFGSEAKDFNRSANLLQKFQKDAYWETLILYSEFHKIMHQLYP